MKTMLKRAAAVTLALALTVCLAGAAASGATMCTVQYYYTSSQNPEGVPKATTGVLNGSKWKIRPAGPSKTTYTKTSGGKTMTYTFDGWYANINCMGNRYAPGKETSSLVPLSSSGRYSLSLYGRWVYSEGGSPPVTKSTSQTAVKNTAPTKSASSAPKNTAPTQAGKAKQSVSKTPADPGGAKVQAENTASSAEKAEPPVTVSVTENRSREEALAGWKHLLIDTFFHLNGRKYSFASPGKYWEDSSGAWNGRTGRNGSTQSCITLPSVSLKRTGLIPRSGGNIWLSSNMASTPNRTVKRLKKSSPMLTIFYPHKSLKYMAAKGMVRYGDILCRSGHTFLYMGKDSGGHPLIYESGTVRDIGNGTRVVWGHHSGGHANKLTGKINKQIKSSDTVGDKWKNGQISDAAFKGHRASGKNLNKPVHIVCSINTFSVRTSCTDGTISPGSNYMAGENVTVSYAPSEGKTLDYVQVDGKKEDASIYATEYTFRRISSDHWINVVYK